MNNHDAAYLKTYIDYIDKLETFVKLEASEMLESVIKPSDYGATEKGIYVKGNSTIH